jgi:hypothetical protein
MNSEWTAFTKMIEKHITAIKSEINGSRFHMEKHAEIAARYNVNASLFRGDGFIKECARKAAARELNAA